MSATFREPQRGVRIPAQGNALGLGPPHPRVLKERRIPSSGQPLPDHRLCTVPSERMGYFFPVPGVAPRAGMRCPVGAQVPGVAPRAGMHCPVGAQG